MFNSCNLLTSLIFICLHTPVAGAPFVIDNATSCLLCLHRMVPIVDERQTPSFTWRQRSFGFNDHNDGKRAVRFIYLITRTRADKTLQRFKFFKPKVWKEFPIYSILTRGVEHTAYIYIYRNYRLFDLQWDSAITWYFAALFVDFCYYWGHRASHGKL